MNRGIVGAIDGKTICAISTPAGMGGIAVIRVSGPEAIHITNRLFSRDLESLESHKAAFGKIVLNQEVLDECLATVFRAPGTFTGENTVEIAVHGSTFIQTELVRWLIDGGCRHAGPGEFTARAFLNGRLDLTQAEAVGDLIAADHSGAHRLAMNQLRGDFALAIGELREGLIGFAGLLELELDFAEEDVEFADRNQFDDLLSDLLRKVGTLADSFRTGNAIREGIPVAIIGAPNRGKSTLLNALLGDERAIVSATAGTTRDTIEDTCIIGGKKFRFIDTAGIRETTDEIESEGIRRALEKAQGASIVLYLFDASVDGAEAVDQALEAAAIGPEAQTAVVWNKTDIAAAPEGRHELEFHVSAAQGLGVEELKNWLAEWGSESQASDALMVTNFRHYEALVEARTALEATRSGLQNGVPGDLVASDVRQALHHLGSITGEIDPEDILDHIFSNFCIGK
ncbi:MAG: tRNA uridine-5-carboxymethylaminomethyl(34) synthesis GTPase MnmE [Flavobacteriales bacterium]|nr:tRNA uridine-5-carboxymethylaminomethyl(34) synthesis GTPase MnmE [Flavobacteriales bacterium]